jgi:hypothetical protein
MEGHVHFLKELEVLATRFSKLGTLFWKPVLGPERLWVWQEVARITMHWQLYQQDVTSPCNTLPPGLLLVRQSVLLAILTGPSNIKPYPSPLLLYCPLIP